MQNVAHLTEDQVLDTRGQLCPMPVIQASKAINKLEHGKVLKIISSDPGSLADIPAWAEASGHEMLASDGNGKGLYTFWVKRT